MEAWKADIEARVVRLEQLVEGVVEQLAVFRLLSPCACVVELDKPAFTETQIANGQKYKPKYKKPPSCTPTSNCEMIVRWKWSVNDHAGSSSLEDAEKEECTVKIATAVDLGPLGKGVEFTLNLKVSVFCWVKGAPQQGDNPAVWKLGGSCEDDASIRTALTTA